MGLLQGIWDDLIFYLDLTPYSIRVGSFLGLMQAWYNRPVLGRLYWQDLCPGDHVWERTVGVIRRQSSITMATGSRSPTDHVKSSWFWARGALSSWTTSGGLADVCDRYIVGGGARWRQAGGVSRRTSQCQLADQQVIRDREPDRLLTAAGPQHALGGPAVLN